MIQNTKLRKMHFYMSFLCAAFQTYQEKFEDGNQMAEANFFRKFKMVMKSKKKHF